MTRHLSAALFGVLCVACSHSHPQKPQPSAALPPPPSATVQGAQPGEPAPRTLEQMMTGKLSGVTVTPLVGGGIAVRMMGPTSFNDANEGPLFIVDGTQVQTQGGALPWINPADIESITALKNPADIAIYGVRGANGV
ncbi:MAG TPA: TonB-dependent receptor plug domain-containing protein, partial [Gemmatimonadales bacterium]